MEDIQFKEFSVEREIAGRILKISTGLVAKQAAGSCLVQYGDTVVLSAVAVGDPRDDGDFFPLMVDYREKTYAAGKFPGGFFKREKAPSTHETLTMRLTDRPIRPLFPKGYTNDVIIQSMVLSSDMENPGDILSMIGSACSCSLSEVPFAGPVGACRIGMKDGEFIVNPTESQLKDTELNLTIAGTADSITMVEAGANNISEDKMLEALYLGHATIKVICEMVAELTAKAGKPKVDFTPPEKPRCIDAVREAGYDKITNAMKTSYKKARAAAYSEVKAALIEQFVDEESEDGYSSAEVKEAIDEVRTEVVRTLIRNNDRIDGRDLFTVRPIDCRIGVLPRTHGSSLFTRGETQALITITLGSILDAQKVDGLHEAYDEQWYVHYQAPGFSVGEARAPRGPGRRDIGHGMLAQRALQAVMPHDEGFAYTVRAVSEVLEMNGSSSMATVCGSTLALMDAGVPIKKPVAGIAMGLIQDEGHEPVIITDILGDEDHYGDMDFKVCGTEDGITALQMDIKITGISPETMRKALSQARDGLNHILGKITGCIATPRAEINERAPRLEMITVASEFLGKIIGKGGETIRALQEETKCEINIEEVDNKGEVTICAPDGEMLKLAVAKIKALCEVAEVGKYYEGPVTGVREFGCFVEILPGTEGMCHVSELSDEFIKDVDEAVKEGDTLKVKVIEIDPAGKVRLSRKAVILEERGETYDAPAPRPARPPRSGGSRGGNGGGGRGGRR